MAGARPGGPGPEGRIPGGCCRVSLSPPPTPSPQPDPRKPQGLLLGHKRPQRFSGDWDPPACPGRERAAASSCEPAASRWLLGPTAQVRKVAEARCPVLSLAAAEGGVWVRVTQWGGARARRRQARLDPGPGPRRWAPLSRLPSAPRGSRAWLGWPMAAGKPRSDGPGPSRTPPLGPEVPQLSQGQSCGREGNGGFLGEMGILVAGEGQWLLGDQSTHVLHGGDGHVLGFKMLPRRLKERAREGGLLNRRNPRSLCTTELFLLFSFKVFFTYFRERERERQRAGEGEEGRGQAGSGQAGEPDGARGRSQDAEVPS